MDQFYYKYIKYKTKYLELERCKNMGINHQIGGKKLIKNNKKEFYGDKI